MKKTLFFILVFTTVNAIAQKTSFNKDAVTYLGKTYKVGDMIHLAYGSGNNKEFVFVNYGKSVGGINLPGLYHHADVNWSKAEIEIIQLYNKNGVIWAKCNPKDHGTSIGSVLGNKIFINIEGAVDNKEIISSTSQKTESAPSPVTKKIMEAPMPVPSKGNKSVMPPAKIKNKKDK